MRKTLTLALLVAASVTVAGCGEKPAEAPAETSTEATADTAVETVPAPETADAAANDSAGTAPEGDDQTGGNEKK